MCVNFILLRLYNSVSHPSFRSNSSVYGSSYSSPTYISTWTDENAEFRGFCEETRTQGQKQVECKNEGERS
jgi:hypothetical protein